VPRPFAAFLGVNAGQSGSQEDQILGGRSLNCPGAVVLEVAHAVTNYAFVPPFENGGENTPEKLVQFAFAEPSTLASATAEPAVQPRHAISRFIKNGVVGWGERR
jgi:hypothetical protein